MNKHFQFIISGLVITGFLALGGSAFGGTSFGGFNNESVDSEDQFFGDVGRSSTSRPRIILNTDARIATSTGAVDINSTRFFIDTASSTLSGFEIRKILGQTANFSEWQDESGNPLVYIDPAGNIYTSGTISSEGVSSTGHLYPASHNTYDIGRYGLAWRDIYTSGTAILNGAVLLGAAGNDITVRGTFNSDLDPSSGNLYDLGTAGIAWRNLFASGTVVFTGATVLGDSIGDSLTANGLWDSELSPGSGNLYDLGRNGVAWRNIYASGTFFGGGVSSTMITPRINNTYDLGAYDAAWRDFYVSGTSVLGGTVTLGTAGSDIIPRGYFASSVIPASGNLYDLGTFNIAWRALYVSTTIVNSGNATFGDSTADNYIFNGTIGSSFLPFANNSFNLGSSAGNAWASVFASSSVVVGGPSNGVSITASGINPMSNNNAASDIGDFGDAWNDIFSSGTTRVARLLFGGSTAPSVSACGTATMVGSDHAGRVTISAGTPTSCTITFGTAFTGNAPSCFGNNETTTLLVRASSTLTTVVLSASAGWANGTALTYGCSGF